jgi:hypothetical protein
VYRDGDVIKCVIDANPPAEVTWTPRVSVQGACVTQGPLLAVMDYMGGRNEWTCEGWHAASNRTLSSVFSFEVGKYLNTKVPQNQCLKLRLYLILLLFLIVAPAGQPKKFGPCSSAANFTLETALAIIVTFVYLLKL